MSNDNIHPLSNSLKSIARQITLKKGESIYMVGDKPSGFYYLIDGLVGLFKISSNGKENILRLYQDESYFGYRSLFSNESYYGCTRALKPSTVLHIPVESLKQLTETAPEVLASLSIQLSEELREAETRLTSLANNKVKKRVIEALLHLKKHHPEYQWTRREIGEYSGGETETVTRICSQLNKDGYLDIKGRQIVIKDWEGLENLRNSI